ncbi:phytase [Sinimarinibacterium thermocellulolyticum]|uniref:Phytase n=1 Tax=Sinimarinibacterium thermocellulolyticum TaxID=3170016 RepID=A0ABV2A6L1_9GAMM
MRRITSLAAALGLAACATLDTDPPLPTVAGAVQVAERWHTVRDEGDNIDSVATWHTAEGRHWLLATAKQTDRLLVFDAATGAPVRKVGEPGSGAGQFDRPNGVFVIDDLAFVVERNNRRVQLLQLPDLTSLLRFGSDGEDALRKPYGLWVHKLASGDYRVYVTDNYETADERVPPPAELDRRVQQFLVRRTDEGWTAVRERSFGATEGAGVLHIVESIWGDPAHGRLLIADEEQYRQRNIKVYGFDGRFTGRRVGAGVFRFQPEGIALYACADGSGAWFATDQGKQENFFHVFDRRSLDYLGSFGSATVLNTDGIWMTQTAMPGFDHGAFYAVHDDGNVAAFDLGRVLDAVGVARCAP